MRVGIRREQWSFAAVGVAIRRVMKKTFDEIIIDVPYYEDAKGRVILQTSWVRREFKRQLAETIEKAKEINNDSTTNVSK